MSPGHVWGQFEFSNKKITNIGTYPINHENGIAGPFYNEPPIAKTVQHTFENISEDIAFSMIKTWENTGWKLFTDNCVSRAEKALNIAGINHPNFKIWGILPWPAKVYIWLNELNGNFEARNYINDAWLDNINLPSHPSKISALDYGGIVLNKSAEFFLKTQDIQSVTYDKNLNQLIIVGNNSSVHMPSMEFDDLAVAVRSIYGINHHPEDPGISIDPKTNKNKINMQVNYFGNVFGTNFGKILFEADFLLKSLIFGKNSFTKEKISSKVPDFLTLDERYQKNNLVAPFSPTFTRLWFVPSEISLTQSNDNSSICFENVQMTLKTEAKFKNNNDYYYNKAAEEFAEHFNKHYDLFSQEFPVLKKLKEFAKIVGIVKWLKDKKIDFDLSLFKDYIPNHVETPTKVPIVSKKFTPNCFIYGGIIYKLTPDNFVINTNDKLKEFYHSAMSTRPSSNDQLWHFLDQKNDTYTAIAYDCSKNLSPGNYKYSAKDIFIPVPGIFPLELNRSYNSFSSKTSPFGDRWEFLPYSLTLISSPHSVINPTTNISCEIYPQIILQDNNSREYHFYCTGWNLHNEPIYKSAHTQFHIIQKSQTFELITDNGTIIFDQQGLPTEMCDKFSNHISFKYTNDCNLVKISYNNKYSINLIYKNEKIIEANDGVLNKIYYSYNKKGLLHKVIKNNKLLHSYSYDVQNRLIKINSNDINDKTCINYDDYNRITKYNTLTASLTNTYSEKEKTIFETLEGFKSEKKYDHKGRLIFFKDSTEKEIQLKYANDSNNIDSINISDGTLIKYKLDKSTNLTIAKIYPPYFSTQKKYYTIWYNQFGRVLAYQDHDLNGKVFIYDHTNKLTKILEYAKDIKLTKDSLSFLFEENNATKFDYNENGNLIAIHQPENYTRLFSYDDNGKITSITFPSGYKINYHYNKNHQLIKINDSKSDHYSLEYNDLNQVTKFKTPYFKYKYSYDNNERIVISSDGNGHITKYFYGTNNILKKIESPDKSTTHFEYSNSGQYIKIKHSSGFEKIIKLDKHRQITNIT